MPTARDHALDLLSLAREDLRAAELLVRAGEALNVICFLAQQAAEKSLKAVLALCEVDYPLTHDLQALLALASGALSDADAFAESIEELGDYAVGVRYDVRLFPTEEDARSAVRLAVAIHEWAGRHLAEQ